MRDRIEALFREKLRMAATEEERRSLEQACRAGLALLVLVDAEERECVLRILEQLSLPEETAEAPAHERVVPFPSRPSARSGCDAEPYFLD